MEIKNLDKFKHYINETQLPYVANIVGEANGISPHLIIQAWKELNWVDYLIANCHNLILSEEQFQHLVDTTIKIEELNDEMQTFIGEDTLSLLTKTADDEMNMWLENHQDEFIEMITKDWLNVDKEEV